MSNGLTIASVNDKLGDLKVEVVEVIGKVNALEDQAGRHKNEINRRVEIVEDGFSNEMGRVVNSVDKLADTMTELIAKSDVLTPIAQWYTDKLEFKKNLRNWAWKTIVVTSITLVVGGGLTAVWHIFIGALL